MVLEKLGGILKGGVETSEPGNTVSAEEAPVENTNPDTPTGMNGVADEELDYRALLEESKAMIAKLENDAKSRDGLARSRQNQDKMMSGVAAKLDSLGDKLAVLFDRESGQDPEFAEKMAAVTAATTTKERNDAFVDVAMAAYKQMERALVVPNQNDDGDTVLLDIHTSPELQGVRDLWDAEISAKNPSTETIQQIVAETERVARNKERQIAADHVKEIQSQASDSVDKAYDMDTGPSGGGSGGGGRSPNDKIESGLKARLETGKL